MIPEIVRFGKWLRRRSPHATTHIHYTNDLQLFFAWAAKPPEGIAIPDVDAYVAHCQDLGHAVATVNRRLTALRVFYRFLDLESDDAPANPVLPQRHLVHTGRRLPRDVQDADLERLFAVITDLRDRAMFLLMLRCGLRVGEMQRLSVGDVYLQPTPGNLPRLWVRGKGDAQRIAYLSPQARAAVQAWLAVRPRSGDPALFLNRFGGRLTVTAIQQRLACYCRQAGLWITCHQLRHTFARHLVEARVPVTSIQRLLGHKRLRTTQVYLHISDQQVQADYEAAMKQVSQRLALGKGGER